jgi:hypothetical protein
MYKNNIFCPSQQMGGTSTRLFRSVNIHVKILLSIFKFCKFLPYVKIYVLVQAGSDMTKIKLTLQAYTVYDGANKQTIINKQKIQAHKSFNNSVIHILKRETDTRRCDDPFFTRPF